VSGTVALVGGEEFSPACTFDRELLDVSGASEVLVVPTGAAYEHPDRSVSAAQGYFDGLGSKARGLMLLARPDALDPTNVAELRAARFVYLTGDSPMHVRSVLKATPCWEAILDAWRDGAVIAGSAGGARVLCDPMVDPRGGAFTLGLGLIEQLAVVPHHDQWTHDRSRRTFELAGSQFPVVVVDKQTAIIRSSDGGWRTAGAGKVQIMLDGVEVGLDALP
jgi:cyanophycinase